MAHIDFKITNNIQLDSNEIRLLLSALRGELKPEDLEPAKKLADALLEQRNARARAWVAALKDVEKKETGPCPE